MDDSEVLARIRQLVDEERDLRERHEGRGGLEDAERERLGQLEVNLDQCWDYLRQRRAAREYGLEQDQASVRSPGVVERYEQ